MRFVFHNPHTLWHKMKLGNFINQTKSMNKYEYLFDYLYNNNREKIYVCIDNASHAYWLRGFLARFETPSLKFYIWVVINKLNPFKFKVIKDIEKLNSDDILMTFLHQNFTNLTGKFDIPREPLIAKFKKTKAFKVVNLSHYGYNTGLGSKNANAADIDLFVSENNLAKNGRFFQHYYQWYKKDVYVLPFVPQKRFLRITKFEDRKNKAIAMGTITFPMADNDFTHFFKDNKLQPMRHEIFNNIKKLEDHLDSYISHISENKPSAISNSGDINVRSRKLCRINFNKYTRILKRLPRILIVAFRILMHLLGKKQVVRIGAKERQYYKFDIVRKYNEYKMFVCPEEVIDLPGIGFVEGMACGSAFLGIRDPMYSDLGLIDKVHYIGYNGTIEDLKEKIEYYQNNPTELKVIAERGYEFVMENFNENTVCEKYFTDLESFCITKQKVQNPL